MCLSDQGQISLEGWCDLCDALNYLKCQNEITEAVSLNMPQTNQTNQMRLNVMNQTHKR